MSRLVNLMTLRYIAFFITQYYIAEIGSLNNPNYWKKYLSFISAGILGEVNQLYTIISKKM